ncbi:PREDICTED: protein OVEREXPRESSOR OF CATIONIC PEROXIDASE 3-like [Camelina sativa]|uniref:Protein OVEREXPRESSOR OF CATIONIC PEROXIDASE 3-like n=1 Tax=Camelina sativa TaxID=90675 RepID=A0ABM0T1X4_CAMSA|nr:PREDICTED: protein OVEREXPRESSOR OF CATIONIC PEROXIDASE 3-like [Camelina sativa]
MAVALSSSSGVVSHLLPPSFSSSSRVSVNRVLFRNRKSSPCSLSLPFHSPSLRSVLVFARGKNRKGFASSSSPSPKKNKKKSFERDDNGESEEEDDPFEALFNLLEEDLKNDNSSIDDEEISEEELNALADELARVLGGGDDDDDGIDLFGSATGDVVDDKDENEDEDDNNDDEDDEDENDDDSEEEDERPSKLKNWQLRRLAYALKAGRRKTSIKNLAAEVCLDRAYVLELLRDPPPKLLMLSATLPDEKPPVAAPENSSPDPTPVESSSAEEEDVVVEPVEKVKDEAVHVMQQRWSAQKRVKKAHIETLEKVYRRSKRPTNAVVSSIVQVTNLPRKRVLKWFEDKRAEDGVPDKRAPYQAPV